MGFLKSIGGFIQKAAPLAAFIPGVGQAGALALGIGGSLLQGSKDQNRANKLSAEQLSLVRQRYNDAAPLRQMALQGLQNTQRRDLTSVYQNPENPFANARARPQMPAVGGLEPQPAPSAPSPQAQRGGFGGLLDRGRAQLRQL